MKFSGSLHLPGLIGHLLHVTKSGAHYILFYTGGSCTSRGGKEGQLDGLPFNLLYLHLSSCFSKGSFCLLAEGALSHGSGASKPSPCHPERRCELGDGDSSQGPTGAPSQVPAGIPPDLRSAEALCSFIFPACFSPFTNGKQRALDLLPCKAEAFKWLHTKV